MTKEYPKRRATLVEIRKEDGAQRYLSEDGETVWITGWPRASNVKVGDTGYLQLISATNYLLDTFRKDKV